MVIKHLLFLFGTVTAVHAGLFGTRAARTPRPEFAGTVTLAPGRGLVVRARDEAGLRAYAAESLGLKPAVVLERAGDEYALNLSLFAPVVNATWLDAMGAVHVLPDERGGITVSAASCAEVDRAGVLLSRLVGERSPTQSFEADAHGCRMDVTSKISPRIAETLGQIRPGVNGLSAALYASGLIARPGRSGAREVRDALEQRCHRRAGAAEFGDLVVIYDGAPPRGPAEPLHAYVHLADDLAYEKPGRTDAAPYWFTSSSAILDAYEVGPLDQFPNKPLAIPRRGAIAYACGG